MKTAARHPRKEIASPMFGSSIAQSKDSINHISTTKNKNKKYIQASFHLNHTKQRIVAIRQLNQHRHSVQK